MNEYNKEKCSIVETKRKRSANWDSLEKNLLRHCIKEFVALIENKNTDTNTNKAKYAAWEKITQRFNELNRTNRTLTEIKQQWRTTKIEAKKNLSERNGGGQNPPTSDAVINEIIQIKQELEVDTNKFDSNGIVWQEMKYNEESAEIVFNPVRSEQNIEEIVVTPLLNDDNQNFNEEELFKPTKVRPLKRKLPFAETNDSTRQRNQLIMSTIKSEAKVKMKQLTELHQWNKIEHELRLKEAKLRIENLELENKLLKIKINKLN